jgi:hypothetical protein
MAGSEDRKAQLIARLAQARARLDTSSGRVRAALDWPARMRAGFQRHAALWLGGAVLGGVLLAKLPARTRKVRVDAAGVPLATRTAARTGFTLAAAKIAFDLARPVLWKLAMERLRPWLERRFGGPEE